MSQTHPDAERLALSQRHWPVGSRAAHPHTGLFGTVMGHRRQQHHSPLALVDFDRGPETWIECDRLVFAVGRTRRDVLLSAAGLLARNGWIPDDYVDYTLYPDVPAHRCPVCTLGAIAVCSGLPPHIWADVVDLGQVQTQQMNLAFSTVRVLAVYLSVADRDTPDGELAELVAENWNDIPEQTADQIIAALLEAALIA